MTPIIGYGEDALTMWALSRRMGEILHQLKDHSPPHDAVVFYRPSCGRGERWWKKRGVRSLFGEFDAIIGTKTGVYLVEAKWSRPGNRNPKPGDGQLERHRIFHSYLILRRKDTAMEWDAFVESAAPDFARAHPGWRLAHGAVSVSSIKVLLERLLCCGPAVTDVLLLIEASSASTPATPRARRSSRRTGPDRWPKFARVVITFPQLHAGTDFFDTQIEVQS